MHHQNQAYSPVGLPDVQGVWVCDAPFVSLLLQEVKKVFDSQGRAVRRDAEDGLEEVIQELLKSSLKRKRKKKVVTICHYEMWAVLLLGFGEDLVCFCQILFLHVLFNPTDVFMQDMPLILNIYIIKID